MIQKLTRSLYLRIGAGVALFIGFAIFAVASELSGLAEERAPILGGLLLGAFLITPRRALSTRAAERLGPERARSFAPRAKQIERWLLACRLLFLLTAIAIFLLLPRLIAGPGS